jgi:polar amino acid transport system substrate-binding protein
MRSLKRISIAAALLMGSGLLAACGGSTTSNEVAPVSDDLLGQIVQSGTLRVATETSYPPQSSYDEATGEWEGFNIDVANEIATRMGVVTQWETPSWDVLTAGSWSDRWDVSVGSMAITEKRSEVLDFTVPYYGTPASIAVSDDSDLTSVDQLAGKRIGVPVATTYEFYLNRTLTVPGFDVEFLVPEDIEIVTYDTDTTAIQDLELGRVDAVLSDVFTLEFAIDQGREIRLLGDPVYRQRQAASVDRSSSLPIDSLVAELNRIITEMHADGTLSELSMKWYGVDITKDLGD